MNRTRHTASRPPIFLEACLPLLGSKRRLISVIFATLATVVPANEWRKLRFVDPMVGGGAVALAAKAYGFDVVASDHAERGAVVARALIANHTTRLHPAELRDLYLPSAPRLPLPTEWQNRHEPEFLDLLERMRAWAAMASEPRKSVRQLLLLKTILRAFPMSQPAATDAPIASAGDFDALTPRRALHYAAAAQLIRPTKVWQLAEQINAGVLVGRGEAWCGDACELLGRDSADVAFLDPPYAGTSSYQRAYGLLDALLDEPGPDHDEVTLDQLLAPAEKVPIVVVTYGGPRVDLEGLKETVGRHRRIVLARPIPHRHLRPLATRNQRKADEYVVVATR